MARVMVPYATSDGHTATIAVVIAEVLRDLGHEAEAVDVRNLPGALPDGYDAFVLGASVRVGKHAKRAVRLVRNSLDALGAVPSALFSVSLAAHGDTQVAQGYVDGFEAKTGWHPDLVGLFAGELAYTSYGFVTRHVMRRVARSKPVPLGLDTSRDYDYTDWDAVRAFAERFAARLASTGARPA